MYDNGKDYHNKMLIHKLSHSDILSITHGIVLHVNEDIQAILVTVQCTNDKEIIIYDTSHMYDNENDLRYISNIKYNEMKEMVRDKNSLRPNNILRLSTLIDAIKRLRITLYIKYSQLGVSRYIGDVLLDHIDYIDNIVLVSNNHPDLIEIRSLIPSLKLGFEYGGITMNLRNELLDNNIRSVIIPRTSFTYYYVKDLRNNGIYVIIDDVDDEKSANELLQCGANAVIV